MRNLKMLRELIIEGCPDLKRRCKKDKGEDWPNIAHILFITMEDETQLILSLKNFPLTLVAHTPYHPYHTDLQQRTDVNELLFSTNKIICGSKNAKKVGENECFCFR